MINGTNGHLKRYSEVPSENIEWLWYPYIASGKITLLQGDPGDGKSTMMLNLISELSNGGTLPNGMRISEPQRSIYQCSEDGISDTIRPRLDMFKADCSNIAFLDESGADPVTLDDGRIKDAIIEFRPKLVVIDPIQAYIGSDSDLFVSGRARKLMHKLSIWASAYNCAIVLVGHFTKSSSAKTLYRGIGSIDVVAAARSVLQIDLDEKEPQKRIVRQVKNSLSKMGAQCEFEITDDYGFKWLKADNNDAAAASTNGKPINTTKYEAVVFLLQEKLKYGKVAASEILEALHKMNVSERTIRRAKQEAGIESLRKSGVWYWKLPGNDN